MAITQNPIIGRTKKSAGGMVFSTVYGKNVMRAKPASYNDQANAEQLTQRSKMTLVTQFVAQIKSVLSSILRKPVTGRSLFSEMISLVCNFFDYNGDLLQATGTCRTIQQGTILGSLSFTVSNTSGAWNLMLSLPGYNSFSTGDINAYVIARNNTLCASYILEEPISDTNATIELTRPSGWAHTNDYSYLVIVNNNSVPTEYSELVVK